MSDDHAEEPAVDSPPPPCESFGLYTGHDDETDDQADVRLNRVRKLVEPAVPGQFIYGLWAGGTAGGYGFLSTPLAWGNLWLIDGAKLVWACQAADWASACRLYHEFMGWEPYVPVHSATFVRLRRDTEPEGRPATPPTAPWPA